MNAPDYYPPLEGGSKFFASIASGKFRGGVGQASHSSPKRFALRPSLKGRVDWNFDERRHHACLGWYSPWPLASQASQQALASVRTRPI